MRIVLELGRRAVDRPLPIGIAQERARQAADDLLRHLEQRHGLPRTGRTLDLELVAVEAVQIHQRPDDQHIDRHPHRAAPVGVAAEHAAIRFGGQVLHLVLLATDLEHERMFQVIARERTNAVRPQELLLVEQVAEHALEFLPVEDRQHPAFLVADETAVGRRYLGNQLGMAFAELRDQLHQLRMASDSIRLEHRRRAQRQQPHHRPDLQAHRLPVGEPQQIVEEPVLLVPHLVVVLAAAVHRIGNPHEMLDELEGDLLVHRVVFGQDQGHLQHALAVERHPGRPVRLLQRATGRQRCAAIEDADVVQAQEAAGKDVAPGRVLAIDPPVEVEHQSLERALQEPQVGPAQLLLVLVQPERGCGVHRRIHVAEVPLVGRNLTARVEVQAAQHQQQLLLGEIEVHQRQGNRVEGQVPGRIPRVLPLVRHGDHVGVEHVEPLGVAHVAAGGLEQRMTLVLAQPALQIEVVVLLAPQHSRQRLAMHPALVFGQRLWAQSARRIRRRPQSGS